ncbi:hypothetical protein COP1_034838 [Malus domestica]
MLQDKSNPGAMRSLGEINNPEVNPARYRIEFKSIVKKDWSSWSLIGRRSPNPVGIDSSVAVESADLTISSVGINSTAARTVGYLSKSRSRRISESLLIENPISAVTPESTSATRREREVNLGGQFRSLEIPNRNTCVLNEGIMEDCDEDGGKGSDPLTRSFFRKRLDEQSRTVEQMFSRGIDKLHDVIRNTSKAQTRLLEILVSKVSDNRYFDLAQHLPPRNNLLPIAPAESIPAQLKPINLEK